MNYLIAVLSDRIQAEAAYSALEKEGLPMEQVKVVGRGYQAVEEYSFLNRRKQLPKQVLLMATWLVPFGFVSGYAFNVSTGFNLFPSLGALGNHLIGALFGAIGGAMGSFFIGGGVSLAAADDNAPPPYPKLVKSGNYVLLVNGAANLTNQATRILKSFKPQSLRTEIVPD